MHKSLLSLIIFLFPIYSFAHGGVPIDQDKCIINLTGKSVENSFRIHFSTYQFNDSEDKQKNGDVGQEFCQELPGEGKTYFVFDLISRELRNSPIRFEIIPLTNEKQNNENLGHSIHEQEKNNAILSSDTDSISNGSIYLFGKLPEGKYLVNVVANVLDVSGSIEIEIVNPATNRAFLTPWSKMMVFVTLVIAIVSLLGHMRYKYRR